MYTEKIAEMCKKRGCCLDPEECTYSHDSFFKDHDCNGPFINKYDDYPKEIKQLLYWNFINVREVEQRHFDAYLKKIGYEEK